MSWMTGLAAHDEQDTEHEPNPPIRHDVWTP